MAALSSPVRLDAPRGDIQCCEHCLTVTWAGVPACDCEFGKLSTSEAAVAAIYVAEAVGP